MDALFRSVHTVKGMSGAMGYAPVEAIAHALESALARLREGSADLRTRSVPAIVTALDTLEDSVEASIAPDHAADEQARVHDAVAALAMLATSPTDRSPQAIAPADVRRALPAAVASTMRVDVGSLDRLLDLAGDLTGVCDRLANAAAQSGDATLARAVADLGRVSGAFGDEVRSARLVAVAELLAELPRVVRQAAGATGKQVAFETHGGDVVADRAVIDALAEPLVHLLRNAVDHGIEAPAARVGAGKPPEGRVVVRAARDGNALVVQVADDGRGVDRDAVAARARARGGAVDGATDVRDGAVDDATLLECLALPGLTTAHTVGNISGRGVGVDAALARVRALGGALTLETAAGVGTTFTLRMPLAWAVVPALVARAGGAAFAIPLVHVRGTREASAADAGAPSLAAVLGAPVRAGGGPDAEIVLLAPASDAPAIAVAVDALVGTRDCVLKPVATPRGAFRIAAGATILDGGEVALVLDVPAVARRLATATPAATRAPT
ncbi:chemotaxis protein CheA [Gemmatimonadetes bacterium T265]|nr:chemotaxis protein CheA [Gemmatimonadetes bacterium T265]